MKRLGMDLLKRASFKALLASVLSLSFATSSLAAETPNLDKINERGTLSRHVDFCPVGDERQAR